MPLILLLDIVWLLRGQVRQIVRLQTWSWRGIGPRKASDSQAGKSWLINVIVSSRAGAMSVVVVPSHFFFFIAAVVHDDRSWTDAWLFGRVQNLVRNVIEQAIMASAHLGAGCWKIVPS